MVDLHDALCRPNFTRDCNSYLSPLQMTAIVCTQFAKSQVDKTIESQQVNVALSATLRVLIPLCN